MQILTIILITGISWRECLHKLDAYVLNWLYTILEANFW